MGHFRVTVSLFLLYEGGFGLLLDHFGITLVYFVSLWVHFASLWAHFALLWVHFGSLWAGFGLTLGHFRGLSGNPQRFSVPQSGSCDQLARPSRCRDGARMVQGWCGDGAGMVQGGCEYGSKGDMMSPRVPRGDF